MKEKGQSSDGLVEAVREYIPLLSSAIQMVFGTVFAFMFIVALAISTLIGMCQVHSLAGRVDALQTKIEEQDRIIDKQGQALV